MEGNSPAGEAVAKSGPKAATEAPAQACSAKTPSQLISLDLWVSRLYACGMKILLMMAVVQSLNLVIFGWFNRVAGLRMLALRQQFAVYRFEVREYQVVMRGRRRR
jgi:hypothetical protein